MVRTAWMSLVALALALGAPAIAGTSAGPTESGGLDRGVAAHVAVVEGVETTAAGLGPAGPLDTIAFDVGSVRAALFGIPDAVPSVASGIDRMRSAPWSPESDVFSGGGVEVTLGRSRGVYVEGGRVALRAPIDVLRWGPSDGEYPVTSAGLEIRF